MDSTLLSGPIGFAYHLIGFNEAREGVGLKLKLTNDRGAAIERVNLIGPAEGGGTSTITLPLQRPIRWLTLPHGAVESSLIDAGNYMVRIERTAIATWRMDFDHVAGEQKVDWFHGGLGGLYRRRRDSAVAFTALQVRALQFSGTTRRRDQPRRDPRQLLKGTFANRTLRRLALLAASSFALAVLPVSAAPTSSGSSPTPRGVV